jgi:serine/threonine protein kinase
MSKAKIIDKKSQMSVKYERDLLSKLKHPFIINMHYAFQDFDNLYLVMDLLTGGDLRYHISKYKRFTEEQTSNFF